MSTASAAKQARRKKRQAARDQRRIPDSVLTELETSEAVNLAAALELLDERITERGWTFDAELSGDKMAVWFYEPSGAEVEGEGIEGVTTVGIPASDNGEFVYLMLVGLAGGFRFTPDELFDHLDVIESYRVGHPRPVFD